MWTVPCFFLFQLIQAEATLKSEQVSISVQRIFGDTDLEVMVKVRHKESLSDTFSDSSLKGNFSIQAKLKLDPALNFFFSTRSHSLIFYAR